ncbi:MAG: M48 family metalloprotease [Sedimentisphaerales bacterium]|nr:M48 family metalloprotease [Sedimentisphaerales bacterium]
MKVKSIFLSSMLYLVLVTGCATNPISGKSQLMLLGEDQDIELGKQYSPEIEKQLGGRIQNTSLQNYLDMVGQRMARVSHKPYFEYTYVALEDDMINAFALPGGPVFITKGMLKKLENEAQLASIFAHETTHVVARHSAAQMSREIGISFALSVASSKASGSAMQVADIASQMIGLSYSRTQEREADIGGLEYMTKAGYDPYEMVKTMQMLEEESQERPLEFFSTHPNPENRIEYIEEEIRMKGYSKPGLKVGADDYKRSVLDELNY